MDQLHTLLQGTLEARGKVLVKLNVAADDLDRVIELLPSMKSPTVSKLFGEDGLRGRDGRAQVRDQHPHPRPQGRRRHRHHRAAARPRSSTDAPGPGRPRSTSTWGCGEVEADDGRRYPFHCTQIADGTRTIAVGTPVTFDVVPGHLGRWEAAALTALTRLEDMA